MSEDQKFLVVMFTFAAIVVAYDYWKNNCRTAPRYKGEYIK
jgi:hypothetical protein